MASKARILQKQPSRDVFRKRCSKNMQQIYRRTSMPKCDFNKVALQFYWNHTSAWVFSCKFAAYFQNNFFRTPFRKNTSGGLFLILPNLVIQLKKRLRHRCFPVNIGKLLKTAFFIEHVWWLLLAVNDMMGSSFWNAWFNQGFHAIFQATSD